MLQDGHCRGYMFQDCRGVIPQDQSLWRGHMLQDRPLSGVYAPGPAAVGGYMLQDRGVYVPGPAAVRGYVLQDRPL